MEPLSVLVLHRLGNPSIAPLFLQRHVFALKNNFPNRSYIYHDISLPLPDYVQATEFDAIILDVTFLCVRWAPQDFFSKVRHDYAFVKQSNCVKLAFPQDEYDHHLDLDDWMCDWGVDVVFSVIPDHWDVLYPRYQRQGEIRLAFTGYLDETLINRSPKPFSTRSIDIGYRATKLPYYFGRLGQTKWTIGRDVAERCINLGLKTDIVLGSHGKLFGPAWLDFIENCKFTLGANSGSSLPDPRGEIQERVKRLLQRNPNASFEEVEKACFSGLDGQYTFTAISPRVMEAALLESCQILVEGNYSGLIEPYEHYIPIAPDASDFENVRAAMLDRALVDRLIKNCRQTILDTKQLRYRHKARSVLELIADLAHKKNVKSNHEHVCAIARRYERDMAGKRARYWLVQSARSKLSDLLEHAPSIARILRETRNRLRRD